MPKPLTANELAARAQAELDKAELAHSETVNFGRTTGRTTRMRAAKRRAGALLAHAVRKGLSESEAKRVFESGPPDPEFGAPEW